MKCSSHSFMNIMGLSLGTTFSVLLFLWVLHDYSTDRFHKDVESIQLVCSEFHYTDKTVNSSTTPYPLAFVLRDENPEILDFTRFLKVPTPINIKYGNKIFHENGCACTDSSFFQIFSFETVSGNFKNVFSSPTDVVISQKIANKYFGEVNPVGKVILIQSEMPATVKGVFKDLPSNSQFKFDIAFSYDIVKKFNPYAYHWYSSGTNTWLKLADNTDVVSLSNKIRRTIRKHKPELKTDLHLKSLTDYYYDNSYEAIYTEKGNKQYLWLMIIIAALLLAIAAVNFVNLSTALSERRLKEIAVNKVLGANRSNIFMQFISESMLVSFIAIVMSIAFSFALSPMMYYLTGDDISIIDFIIPVFALYLVVFLIMGVLGGLYPALILSRKSLTESFRPMSKNRAGVFSLEKVLVVTQFAIAVILIVSTILINKQMNFLMNKKLGFDKEYVTLIKSNNDLSKHYLRFKNDMKNSLAVEGVSCIGMFPAGLDNWTPSVWWEGKDPSQKLSIAYNYVDPDFISVMGIETIAGRNFNINLETDLTSAYVINQQAQQIMGLQNPIGKQIDILGNKGKIIGVVRNPLFHSLHTLPTPRLFKPVKSPSQFPDLRTGGSIIIRVKNGLMRKAIKEIKTWCANNNISVPPDFSFLENTYKNMYKKEDRIRSVFMVFSALSIFISCLGIFILNTFYTQKKSKEIAVRKINGASERLVIRNILAYLFKWITVSVVVAIPLSVVFLNKWLENFSYKTNLSWWIFLIGGVAALFIAVTTVIWQSWKAATRNPVESLRYE